MPSQKVQFGHGSWSEIERSVWDIWYGVSKKTYEESGLHIYITKQDVEILNKTFKAGAIAWGAIAGSVTAPGPGTAAGAVAGGAMGALASLGQDILSYLATDERGAYDIHIAPHGFQCSSLPAADPNVWTVGLWAPVRDWLEHLPGNRKQSLDQLQHKYESTLADEKTSQGKLVEVTPLDISGRY
jgi:hypothetical protein